ncbi:zinc finger protein 354B [Diabrotica virgifera virgifera]|uniref:Zinc finger protein 354B-like n=1 Tax=Diabrotica virgifera virgifera TaxID=50390 RepID=A0A6P7FD73_DIAVI|nr:zinc finger protein 354B [Diabrotica virgifera virgifera]
MDKVKQGNFVTLYKCRVCLDDVERLYPLEGPIANCDVDIATMITYCTSIEIDLNDDLPHGVCVPCFRTIRIAYNFIIQFRENNLQLLKEKSSLESVNEDEYDYEENDYETQVVDAEDNTDEIELYCEALDSDDGSKSFLEPTEIHLEAIKYNVSGDQELAEQNLVEYDQQDVEIENMNFLVDSLETIPDTSADIQNTTTIKTIKTSLPPDIKQPQTATRRKIKVQFACPICPKAYFVNFETGFVSHMSLHTGQFPCNICTESETLYTSDSFLNHFMQFHRYQCPYCRKSYNKAGTLGAHIKLHYKIRYHCSHNGCNKSFPTQWGLKKHVAVHSDSCAYSCAECNKQFKTYDTYMYHQKKHGGRKFLCMCCGRTFLQSVHLKYHMQQHTGIKQFKCNLCVKSYTSTSQLKKHKRRHHPDQIETSEMKPYIVDLL